MSKKKVFSLITISILILFLISTAVSFISVRQTRHSMFISESEKTVDSIYNRIPVDIKLEDDFGSREATEVFEEIVADSSQGNAYPYLMAVYDEDNNVICSSGSYIRFDNPLRDSKEELVRIDDYITPEIKSQIRDYLKENNCDYPYPSEFHYDIEDSKIIPRKLILNNNCNKNTLTVSFSSANGKYRVIAPNGTYSTDGNYCMYLDALLYNVYEDKFQQKLYNILNDEITNDTYSDTIVEAANEVDFGFGSDGYSDLNFGSQNLFYLGNDKRTALRPIEYMGKTYVIYQSVIHNNEYDTIHSALFKELMLIQSVLFVIVSIFIYLTANILYKKNRRITESKQAFTAAAAHELKTPLSVIQNQCECILDGIAPEKNERYVQSIYDESLRMNKLVMTLLQYNRLAVSKSVDREKCSLSEIVSNELSKYNPLISSKNIFVRSDIDENAVLECNKELIELAVDNFISNAVKHTEDDKKIDIILKKTSKGNYKLSVINEGKGIKKEFKENLWDILYRDDKSRNSSDNSTGMGLAICKKIFDLHGYKYGYNNTGNGVEFYFITK